MQSMRKKVVHMRLGGEFSTTGVRPMSETKVLLYSSLLFLVVCIFHGFMKVLTSKAILSFFQISKYVPFWI